MIHLVFKYPIAIFLLWSYVHYNFKPSIGRTEMINPNGTERECVFGPSGVRRRGGR